jgi:transposase
MAVRGLGCPVRFTLTAGQKGDAPQAAALIEGLSAEVVMADTAYDADHLRQAIAAKGAIAVIPNNPVTCTQISARQAPLCPAPSRGMLLLKAQAVPTRRELASKKRPEITLPSSLPRIAGGPSFIVVEGNFGLA